MSLLVFFLCLLSTLEAAAAQPSSSSSSSLPPFTSFDSHMLDRLSSFISLGTSYLVRVSHTERQDRRNPGKFTYIAYLQEDLPVDFNNNNNNITNNDNEDDDDYNLLRHNGAIYSLALSYHREPRPEVLEAMKRAVNFLTTRALGPVPDGTNKQKQQPRKNLDNMLAAWETADIIPGMDYPIAKLGGAGLALVALVSLKQIVNNDNNIELSTLRQLGEFILYMQNDDGSFVSRYKPTKGGKDDSWTSLYYPGEASLGLLQLASLETDLTEKQRWIDGATRALKYLERLRRHQTLRDIEPDHWALLATERLLPLLDPDTSADYWLVYEHGVQVSRAMVHVLTRQQLKKYHGCHTADARTCPTATRLEGLLAALSFVGHDERYLVEGTVENLRERMWFFIEQGMEFLLASQETSTEHGMQGGVPVRFPIRESDRNTREVRVDYVQHSMSAAIAYEKLLLLLDDEKKTTWKESMGGRVQRLGGGGRGGVTMATTTTTMGDNEVPWFLLAVAAFAVLGVLGFMSWKKPKKLRTH